MSNSSSSDHVDGSIIVEIPDVSCYRLKNDKRTLLSTSNLTILLSMVESKEIYLLILDNFQLVANKSIIILKSCKNTYLIPFNDYTYAVVLPDNCDLDYIEIVESIFIDYCSFKNLPIERDIFSYPQEESFSFAPYIEAGAHILAKGIEIGAGYLGQGIHKASEFIVNRTDRLTEEEKKSNTASNILKDENTLRRLHQARIVSSTVVKLSRILVEGAIHAVCGLSSIVAVSVESSDMGKKITNAESPKSKELKKSAIAILNGVSEIVKASQVAGLSIVHDTTEAVAKVVVHRYGDETVKVAQLGTAVVKDFGEASVQMQSVGAAAMTASVVKQSAVKVLSPDSTLAVEIDNSNSNNVDASLAMVGSMVDLADSMLPKRDQLKSLQQNSSSSNSSFDQPSAPAIASSTKSSRKRVNKPIKSSTSLSSGDMVD